jgi:isopentenyl diphosphate isomerase/L-lactate dehydrogenase-like FMN-dependent dehydrogenase
VAGEAGVERVLSILAAELDRDMALLGCARLSEVTSELLGRKTVAPL